MATKRDPKDVLSAADRATIANELGVRVPARYRTEEQVHDWLKHRMEMQQDVPRRESIGRERKVKERTRLRPRRERHAGVKRDPSGWLELKVPSTELVQQSPADNDAIVMLGRLLSGLRTDARQIATDTRDSLHAAAKAVFGMPVRDLWALRLAMAILTVKALPEPVRIDLLRSAPALLVAQVETWQAQAAARKPVTLVVEKPVHLRGKGAIPRYVDRAVVRWAVRHVTPTAKAGRGCYTVAGLARLLRQPKRLADALERPGRDHDKATARRVRAAITGP